MSMGDERNDRHADSKLSEFLTPTGALKTMFRLFRVFVTSFLVRAVVLITCGVVVAVIVYFILKQDQTLRGPVGAVVAMLVTTIAAVVIAFQTSIVATGISAVEGLGVGRMFFDYAFAGSAGNSANSDSVVDTQSFDGLSGDEVHDKLTSSATSFIDSVGVGQKVPRVVRWLATKVLSLATGGVVNSIMSYAAAESVDGERRLDMQYVRTELGATIDQKVADDFRQSINQKTRYVFGAVLVVTLVVAFVVAKYLP